MESGRASGAGSLDESPPVTFPRCAPLLGRPLRPALPRCSGPRPLLVPEEPQSPDCPGLCWRPPLAAGVQPRSRAGADERVESAQATQAPPRRAPGTSVLRLGRDGVGMQHAGTRAASLAVLPVRGRAAWARGSRSVVAGWLVVAGTRAQPAVPRCWHGAPPPPMWLYGLHGYPGHLLLPTRLFPCKFPKDRDPRAAPADFPCPGHTVCGDE